MLGQQGEIRAPAADRLEQVAQAVEDRLRRSCVDAFGGRDSQQSRHEVVDALLLLSTVAQQSVDAQPLDMGRLVSQALSQLTDLQTRTQASVLVPKVWPRALGYAPWVGEVWLNLLSNALKYGGSPPRLELDASADGSRARFWVNDNGQPLSEDERMRVFLPFTRLQQERAAGHGLGLTTVQRIVSKLGGEVWTGAAPGGGNQFGFTLPASAAPAHP